MEHRRLYKASGRNFSPNKRMGKAIAAKRARNRETLYSQQRDLTVSGSEEPAESAAALSEELNFTKSQKYYLKFLLWQKEKREKQPTTYTRPFTSAVAAKKFLSPQLAIVPRNHIFRPPANLPQLTLSIMSNTTKRNETINEVIVTRSMAAARAKEAAAKAEQVIQKPSNVSTKKISTNAPERKILKPIQKHLETTAHSSKDVQILKENGKKIPSNKTFLPPKPIAKRPVAAKTCSSQPDKAAGTSKTTLALPKASRPVSVKTKVQNTVPKCAQTQQPVNFTADITADNSSHFLIDGSMITSTAQKPQPKRPSVQHISVDLFSPIEAFDPVPKDLNVTPPTSCQSPINYVSPFVSTSRGKVSARKERKQRESVYKLDLNRSQTATDVPIDDVETRRRHETALYFRKQIETETNRLLAMADQWQQHKELYSYEMLSEYIDLIDVTIGQTRLLLNKKFRQFHGLIDQCESGDGEQKVMASDLEGFWSMIYMQVEQCNARFERLDTLKASEWKEAEDLPNISKGFAATKAKKTKAPVKKTGILDMLKESRAKFRQQMLEKKAAARKEIQETPKKTPSKNLLKSCLLNETAKQNPTPQKQTPSIRKSIMKTPATNRRTGRGVVFVGLNGSPPSMERRTVAGTPMPLHLDENTSPVSSKRNGARVSHLKPTQSTECFVEAPVNIMHRLSLSGTPDKKASSPAKVKTPSRQSRRLLH